MSRSTAIDGQNTVEHIRFSNQREQAESKSVLGFWIYLMTDCVLFASLFAVYAVLHKNVADGPSGPQIFSLPYILVETLVLLTSSFTSGLAMLAAHRGNVTKVLTWFSVTALLGASFLAMELTEFGKLVHEGHSWTQSGFLSSYFTLVGTHGLHITVGLLWIILLLAQVTRKGLNTSTMKRLTLFSIFWHFLDLIWIFIFTVVYLSSGVNL
jgi:cytochrome o ubiquinol oxidase subunit 3